MALLTVSYVFLVYRTIRLYAPCIQVVYTLCSRIPRHPAYLCVGKWADIISISDFQTQKSTINKK